MTSQGELLMIRAMATIEDHVESELSSRSCSISSSSSSSFNLSGSGCVDIASDVEATLNDGVVEPYLY